MMQKYTLALALLLLALPAQAQLIPSFGGDRAPTGFQFLQLPPDARAVALGQAVVGSANDATALFWNPALAAQADGAQVTLSHTAYFADIPVVYAAATYPWRGLTFGVSLHALDAGDMNVTTELEPFGTGETFGFSGVAAGLSVAQKLTDLFSYGVTAKYVRESTVELVAQSLVADLGFFYRVGETGLNFAVAVRNFGLDGSYEGEICRPDLDAGEVCENDFETLTPPTTFFLNATYDVLKNAEGQDLFVTAQLNNPNDNAENFTLGAEYVYRNLFIVRGGYRFGVEEATWPSVGVGFNVPLLDTTSRIDYGYTRLDRLGDLHSISLNLRF